MFPAVCGDGFEAARAYGKGAAGGDAAVHQEEEGMIPYFFFRFLFSVLHKKLSIFFIIKINNDN